MVWSVAVVNPDTDPNQNDAGPVSLTRPSEPIRERVALLTAAYACVVLMQRSAEGTSLSLFLDQLGAKQLPLTFLAVSLVDIPLAFAYMALARRFDRRWLLAALGAALVTAMVVARIAGSFDPTVGFFAAYLASSSLGTFLVIHWGVLLLDTFTVEESRRAFPLVYAGGHVGSFAAGASMQLAGPWTAWDLLIAVPGFALLGVVVLMTALGKQREGMALRERIPRPGAAAAPSAYKNLGLLSRSPLLRIIAASTAIMMLLRLCLRFLYGHELQAAFASPESLTRFLGMYTMVASAVGLSVQLLATPRLLQLFGVGKVNVAYAGAMLLSFVGLLGTPGLLAATVARFTDLELKGAIKTPMSTMFYDALGRDERADARAVILGIVSPLSSIGSSLALVAFSQLQTSSTFLAQFAVAGAVLYVVLSMLQARAYRRSLEEELLRWARGPSTETTIEQALEAARQCADPRVADMAREIRRHRRN